MNAVMIQPSICFIASIAPARRGSSAFIGVAFIGVHRRSSP